MARMPDTLRIPTPQPPSYDVPEANRLIDQAFASQGWLDTNDLGESKHNFDKLRHAVFVAFTTNHIVTSVAAGNGRRTLDNLVNERAITKYGLYIELFPNGPAARSAPASEEEQAAKAYIADYLWKLTTPTSRNAWLQKELADSGLVVLETKLYPTDPSVLPQPGRYVTNVDAMLIDFLEHKVLADVRKKVNDVDQWLATLMLRNPNIALPAARKAKAALKAAVDSAVHANPTYVRETLALTAGSDEGDDNGTSDS
jgi:hypothetical protein